MRSLQYAIHSSITKKFFLWGHESALSGSVYPSQPSCLENTVTEVHERKSHYNHSATARSCSVGMCSVYGGGTYLAAGLLGRAGGNGTLIGCAR